MADDSKVAKLRNENARLILEKENATLRAEIGAIAAPWWRKSSTVTLIAAILAAIMPATTAVQGHFQKERELALEEKKQRHAMDLERERQTEQIRNAYLDRLKNEGELVRTLRFVEATNTDLAMRTWATTERTRLEDTLKKWQDHIDTQTAIAKGLEDELRKRSGAQPSGDPQLDLLRANSARAQKRLEDIKARFDTVARPCNCQPGDPLCSCL